MRKQTHLPALDGVRGLAVIAVFIFHYSGGARSGNPLIRLIGFLIQGGWTGVTIFFVLSGFLITGILWDSFADHGWYARFYMRRTLRIFPLYYAALLLVLGGALLQGTLGHALGMIWVPALFLQNFPGLAWNIDHLPSPLPLYHFWSLAVEEQFYIFWPLLLVLQRDRKRAARLCLLVFAASFVFRVSILHLAAHPQEYAQFLLTRAGELAAGGWLAIAYRGPEWTRVQRTAPLVFVAGLIGFFSVGYYAHSLSTASSSMMEFGIPAITLASAAFVAMSLQSGLTATVASVGFLRWIGGLSFGIYVYHVLFARVFEQLAETFAGNRSIAVQKAVLFVVAALGSVALAWLSYNFYEKRFLRIKARLEARPVSK